jgi:hypothetical protein
LSGAGANRTENAKGAKGREERKGRSVEAARKCVQRIEHAILKRSSERVVLRRHARSLDA